MKRRLGRALGIIENALFWVGIGFITVCCLLAAGLFIQYLIKFIGG